MKKNEMLIAVLSIAAFAAPAAALSPAINFDGAAPQTMHDIFTQGHHLVPPGMLEEAPAAPAPAKSIADSPCSMVCFPHNPAMDDGQDTDCCGGTQVNSNWNYCAQVEVGNGLTIPVCPMPGVPVPAGDFDNVLAGMSRALPAYAAGNEAFAGDLAKLAADKDARVVFDGKRLLIVRFENGRWVASENAGAQTRLEVAYPQHTIEEAFMGGLGAGVPGIVVGAVHGFITDVTEYANKK